MNKKQYLSLRHSQILIRRGVVLYPGYQTNLYTREPLVVLYDIEGRVEYGPLRTHVFVYDVHKGVMEGPLDSC